MDLTNCWILKSGTLSIACEVNGNNWNELESIVLNQTFELQLFKKFLFEKNCLKKKELINLIH